MKTLLYCNAECSNEACWQNLSTMEDDVDKSIMVADLSEGCEQKIMESE